MVRVNLSARAMYAAAVDVRARDWVLFRDRTRCSA
jgi:hypothetical protein